MRMYGFDRYGDRGVERFFDVMPPEVTSGTVLVAMRAAGVNPADLKVRSGLRQDTFPVTFPMALGREVAGTVLQDPSATYAAGTLVFGSCATGSGGLGEQALLDLDQTAPVPEGVSAEQAACIPVAIATAWDGLCELSLRAGETVVILGAGGGVGLHAVQLARHLGARVIGVASTVKAPHVTRAGATHVPSGAGWAGRVRELAPTGADAALDTVGGDALGEVVPVLSQPQRLRSAAAPARAVELGGSGITRRRTSRVYAEVAELVAKGVVRPVISAVYPLGRAHEATAAVATGHALGKVVVTN